MKSEQGIAMLTVLILVILLTLLAGSLLVVLSNQTFILSHNARRARARYATEAAMVRQLEILRSGQPPEASWSVDDMTVTIDYLNTSGELNLTTDYDR